MVRANVFFENSIHLRSIELLNGFKEFIARLPEKVSSIFAGIECPKALRFLLPLFARVIERVAIFKKFLLLKLQPVVHICQRFIERIQYWIINPVKLRANAGVATFSYSSIDARKTFGLVALAHAIIFLILFSLSSFQDKKRPEITIEIGEAPKASDGAASTGTEKAPPSPVKGVSKTPSVSDDANTELVKAQELKRLERKLEKQKELELEREKRKEAEREKQKQKEREQELNLERVRELERDRQRARELEQEKRRELERERQRAKELEQEKKKEQDRIREQDRQQRLRERQQQEEKRKEKLLEPKKLEKDGTLPPPPAPPSSAPAVPASSAPAAPPPPSGGATSSSSSSSASGSPAAGAGSPPAGSGGSISASVSNGPASAPTLDSEPKPMGQNNPKPTYPLLAFKMKIQGKVILMVDVSESGAVNKVAVAVSSGNDSLDQSALEAVKNWKFTPARKNGVIVSQVVRVPITFSLKNR